jgi:hypothetical protein
MEEKYDLSADAEGFGEEGEEGAAGMGFVADAGLGTDDE